MQGACGLSGCGCPRWRIYKKFKPDAKVLYTTEERVEILEGLRVVDEVVVYQTVGTAALEKIDFDILALGEDHCGGRFNEIEKWCDEHNKKVVRLKRTPEFVRRI